MLTPCPANHVSINDIALKTSGPFLSESWTLGNFAVLSYQRLQEHNKRQDL